MKIIKKAQSGTSISFSRSFHYVDEPGAGFSFPYDEKGSLLNLNPEAKKNYEACITGTAHGSKVIDDGIKQWQHRFNTPAIGECDCCEKEVVLFGFTNTCDCGADYNSCGQRLADRSQWGEETGESLDEILGID